MSNGPGPGSVRYGAEAGFFANEAENFKATLNTKDAEDFEDSSFDLVRQTAEFQEVDSIMACIWGPMRFFLKTTNINERAFDDILDVYYRLGLNIPRFTDYMHVFQSSRNGIMCLVNTYKDVLKFHSTAYKLFSLRSQLWAKLHRATWRDLNPTFDHISSTLELHTKCIQDHGSFMQQRMDSGFDDLWRNDPIHNRDNEFRVYEKAYKESQGDFREREKERKTQQRTKIITWIAASTRNDILHKSFQRKRSGCPENGEWLWHQHDEVSNWMREDIPGESTIWINGPRGMGKTILSSHVIDRLGKFAKEGPEVPSNTQTLRHL
ncbi:hypothetical protein CFRS1_v013779 [Colletotrichum fructicola]|nr:hypothetical protein CFRS1_v013779 [Colletotrichum fructicola]